MWSASAGRSDHPSVKFDGTRHGDAWLAVFTFAVLSNPKGTNRRPADRVCITLAVT